LVGDVFGKRVKHYRLVYISGLRVGLPFRGDDFVFVLELHGCSKKIK